MKKVIVFLFVCFLVAFGTIQSFGQSFNGGLIVGPTFCQVDGDHYAGFHQLGFTAGTYINLPLEDHLSAQMELKYSLLGAHSSHKEVTEYYYAPYSLRLHYAEIPLMLRYDLGYEFEILGLLFWEEQAFDRHRLLLLLGIEHPWIEFAEFFQLFQRTTNTILS